MRKTGDLDHQIITGQALLAATACAPWISVGHRRAQYHSPRIAGEADHSSIAQVALTPTNTKNGRPNGAINMTMTSALMTSIAHATRLRLLAKLTNKTGRPAIPNAAAHANIIIPVPW